MSYGYELEHELWHEVTPTMLQDARARVTKLCDMQAPKDRVQLAEQLQGAARAIVRLIHAHGTIEIPDLREAKITPPDTAPHIQANYILRHYDNPQTRKGRMFVAQQGPGGCVQMAVLDVREEAAYLEHEVMISTDRQIDRLLMEDPLFWQNNLPSSRDCRPDEAEFAYPFDSLYYTDDAIGLYVKSIHELGGELLTITKG